MFSMDQLVKDSAKHPLEIGQCLTGAPDELHGATNMDPTTETFASGRDTTGGPLVTDEEEVCKKEIDEIKIDASATYVCGPQLLMVVGLTSTFTTVLAMVVVILRKFE
ncbi:unnamed protein product [Cylicocyclus nassatus]|uniref:Uncharacterized protein n=1 Tax=Cylicocyclus nassatus TaxID=53992 RepID=A0AA36DM40_CYLNA|nr:unnamed protein product [Cylicocyclus nassatus]